MAPARGERPAANNRPATTNQWSAAAGGRCTGQIVFEHANMHEATSEMLRGVYPMPSHRLFVLSAQAHSFVKPASVGISAALAEGHEPSAAAACSERSAAGWSIGAKCVGGKIIRAEQLVFVFGWHADAVRLAARRG